MLKYHLMIALIFFLQSCTQENADGIQNNFDTEQLNKYKADLKQQYKNLVVVEQEVMTMDFIKLYFSDSTLYEKYNYSIEYKCEIYKLDKDHHKYLFYGEVIHFKKSNDIDSVISYIKDTILLIPSI